MDKKTCGTFFENFVTTGYCHTNDIGFSASSYYENTYQHIDFSLQRPLERDSWTIDVKAPKRMCRGDDEFTRNVLLEFTGCSGHPGWLRGKADRIGFYLPNEDDDGFELWVFERKDLLDFVVSLPGNPYTPQHYICTPPTGKWLQRATALDSFIWVPIEVLKDVVPHWSVSDVTDVVTTELKSFLAPS